MGRVTEVISFINEKEIPTELETKHIYTHCNREDLKRLRKKYLKNLHIKNEE